MKTKKRVTKVREKNRDSGMETTLKDPPSLTKERGREAGDDLINDVVLSINKPFRFYI